MGVEQERIVLKFIEAFRDSWPVDFDELFSLCAEDVYYDGLVGLTKPIRGRDAVKAAMKNQQKWVEEQKHETLNVGSNDRIVFTERMDGALVNGVWAAIPLVGVFEVNSDGKISAWREYCDSANVARQQNMSVDDVQERLKD